MPAEFARHVGCWIFWPERTDNWRNGAKPAQKAFAEVASAIGRFEPVTVACSASQFKNARTNLPDYVRVIELSYNDAWARDIAPTFVTNGKGETRGVDWRFNSWGGLNEGLYFPWDLDDAAKEKIFEIERVSRYRADFVLEGGAIHVDGEGTLIATEDCVLNKNRNPEVSKAAMEEKLQEHLGVEKFVWLKRGLWNDETGGHVDNLCCFARPGVVALHWTDDKTDPQYEIAQEAFDTLSREQDAKGRSFEIHRIHQPRPLTMTKDESAGVDRVAGSKARCEGDRLTASYINFYIANNALIAPLFDDSEHDSKAMQSLKMLFPDRQVIPVAAREILLGGGGIHCITQQQPEG